MAHIGTFSRGRLFELPLLPQEGRELGLAQFHQKTHDKTFSEQKIKELPEQVKCGKVVSINVKFKVKEIQHISNERSCSNDRKKFPTESSEKLRNFFRKLDLI